jgi:rhodanese-related sulfurtransferase
MRTKENNVMFKNWIRVFMAFVLILTGLGLTAVADEDTFGLSARETYALVKEAGDTLLFIDVRDPVEIMFTGFTDVVDVNLPFRLVDRTQVNRERGVFAMPVYPGFVDAVRAALREKGLEDDSRIITMCRSGSARGEPSAAYLRENGFPNVFFVRHGFQGDPLREGPQAGMRLANGWQNEGLPWSPRMNPDKIFVPENP